MFIILDTDNNDLRSRVLDAMNTDDRHITNFDETEDAGDVYVPGSGFHVLEASLQVYPKTAKRRWIYLRHAALGTRLYSDTEDKHNPIYAGKLPETDEEIRRLILDAKFAESRAEYFKSFGVNYIGRTNLTPRSIIVLDNKKNDPYHSPIDNETLDALYTSMPDDWWGSCGLVSSSSTKKLTKFMEALEETVPLAFSTRSITKLENMGLEYGKVGTPKPTQEYGISLRQETTKFSWLA
ncbi:Hypothetical Protein OBI_RACECAR_99 [Arthrobacter phage Racecar]|nr:hypothetical protein PBI_RACECAR_181 [Arthrobacter phage Racecar]QFG12854.1 hypothetical protein PBI_MIMI_178 [Arthrobacter phage Mimi]